MIRPTKTLGAGAATVAAVALAVVAMNTRSNAQEPGYASPPMQPRMDRPPMQHEPGMPGGGGGMMMAGPGPAVMIDDAENLYVLRGGDVFKIDKDDMRVKGQAHLPMGGMGREGMRRDGPPDLMPPRSSEMKPQ